MECDQWLKVKSACDAFDGGNSLHATVPHREAALLVSCAQPGSGSWLHRLPDHSLRGSVVTSLTYTTMLQRRIGLYTSVLTASLAADATARRRPATQHELLGDAATNAANATQRHNAGLRCVYDALLSASPAHVALQLCDRGDGTELSKQEALARFAHFNAGHVPDILSRDSVGDDDVACLEFKCATPFHKYSGDGSRGGVSPHDGWRYAFGSTLEKLVVSVLGLAERGTPADGAFKRTTGTGHVSSRDGDYADALRRRHRVLLLATETTGAVCPDLHRLLRHHATLARKGDAVDNTAYGLGRASPQQYLPHHLARLSAAVVTHDAQSIRRAARELDRRLTTAPTRPPA